MKKVFYIVVCSLIAIGCGKNQSKSLTVQGDIEGLKKGMLYLQKIEDTLLVAIDSLLINGNSNFVFKTELDSPEMLYLYLNKKDGNDLNDRITFFAEPGKTIRINTSRAMFEVDAEISGSDTQKLYEDYNKGKFRYNNLHLDLVKAQLEARIDSNQTKMDSINHAIERNALRSYLYTINYALNHKDSYVAPYLVLSEAYDAQIKYLDTINNSLTPEVASSKYGIMLQDFIKRVKLKED